MATHRLIAHEHGTERLQLWPDLCRNSSAVRASRVKCGAPGTIRTTGMSCNRGHAANCGRGQVLTKPKPAGHDAATTPACCAANVSRVLSRVAVQSCGQHLERTLSAPPLSDKLTRRRRQVSGEPVESGCACESGTTRGWRLSRRPGDTAVSPCAWSTWQVCTISASAGSACLHGGCKKGSLTRSKTSTFSACGLPATATSATYLMCSAGKQRISADCSLLIVGSKSTSQPAA